MLDEDVGGDVPELASGYRVDGDTFLSCPCGDSLKSTWPIVCRGRKWLHASVMIYRAAIVSADVGVVVAVLGDVVPSCCCCHRW